MDIATKRRSHTAPSSKPTETDRLAADFRAFIGDVEQAMRSASNLPGDSLSAARAELEEKVAQARARLADGLSDVRGAGEAYLRERPMTVLGIVLLIGAAAGVLLARRG